MPLVRAGLYAPDDWRKPSTVLFDRTPASVLGGGAPLDDAGGRGGPTQRRVLEGALEEACTLPQGNSSREEGVTALSDLCRATAGRLSGRRHSKSQT